MADVMETLRRSQVQHGSFNDRVYLMKLDPGDLPGLLDDIEALRARHGYTKVFAKVPASHAPLFRARGYEREAGVPGLFQGIEDAHFMCWYGCAQRRVDPHAARASEILTLAQARQAAPPAPGRLAAAEITEAGPAQVEAMSHLYAQVFPSYPFPIQDPSYLLDTMRSHVRYFCVLDGGELCAVASSEMDVAAGNVEMTDFATEPSHRGRGLAVRLLGRMEVEMKAQGMRTAYTIARALSAGMNITFARMGYAFGGRLVNNTNISGHIESMNVWHKGLSARVGPRG